jgi:hypothetical protein
MPHPVYCAEPALRALWQHGAREQNARTRVTLIAPIPIGSAIRRLRGVVHFCAATDRQPAAFSAVHAADL